MISSAIVVRCDAMRCDAERAAEGLYRDAAAPEALACGSRGSAVERCVFITSIDALLLLLARLQGCEAYAVPAGMGMEG